MSASRQPPAAASTRSHKILVVDDIQDNLDLMVEVLEDGPRTVATACDGESALKQASETAFDLFLLDVHMPDIDGFELCRRLRREPGTRNIPVIFVTAERTSTEGVIEGLDSGAFDYIVKPFDRAELLARVRVMLRLRDAERCYLVVQGALNEQNQQLSGVNDRLAEACQQMLEQRVELMHKTHELERANRVKSEFLAKMSHELRTPMNSVIGFTDLMSCDKKDPPTERQARRLEKVGRNGRQLLALINDILDLSKIEAERLTLDLTTVELPAVLEECLELAKPLVGDKPVAFESRIPYPLSTWQGDEVRLRQIVTNLLSNAAKFTDRGTITLEVDERNEDFSIAVSDTGVGIAPEHLAYVFDAFRQVDSSSTRRAGGTGLGLAICRRLCELMGGEIEVRSKRGGGSIFEIKLPWHAAQRGMDRADSGERATPQCTKGLLLCTNDVGMVDLANAHLARHGIEVRHVDAGNIASGLIQGGRPEGVLIDVRCPATAAVLRLAAEASLPLLWLTAWTEDHQLGCRFMLDGVIPDLQDKAAVLRAAGGAPPDNPVVLLIAGSENIRAQLRSVLAESGCQDIRVANDLPGAIRELTSGNIATVVVHLGDHDVDMFEFIERARRVPEWSSVRIVGVIPRAHDDDETYAVVGPPAEFVRRHGESTPTLLLDIAERVMAEPVVEAVGAHL